VYLEGWNGREWVGALVSAPSHSHQSDWVSKHLSCGKGDCDFISPEGLITGQSTHKHSDTLTLAKFKDLKFYLMSHMEVTEKYIVLTSY
jgi:hypothetical protein